MNWSGTGRRLGHDREIDHQYVKVNAIEAVGIVGVLLYLNLSAFNDTHCTTATVHTVDVRIS